MYDGVADFPQWLANPVAVANAIAGFQYIHGTYLAPDSGEPATDTPYGYTPEEVQDYISAAQADGGCDAGNPTTANTSMAATRSTSRCRRATCRYISRSSTSAMRPARRR